jgi:uncharacterized protein (DUF697 family)
MIPEPFSTILLLIVIPVLHQLYKIYKDKTGKTLSKGANQAISLVLAGGAVALSGGFAGLPWPDLPVFADDIPAFITAVADFASKVVEVMTLAWGTLYVAYEFVHKRWMDKVGFVTSS